MREPLKLYFSSFDLLTDPWVDKIINHVKRNKPRVPFSFPSWNLDLVVRMLRLRVDEDLGFIFKKSLFIVFLACPYRISEFKSISVSSSAFSPHHVLLRPHPLFVSKNQSDDFTPSPIVIQEFPEIPTLCPVSLINRYLDLTNILCSESKLPRPDQLWLNINLKPLSAKLIRKWIREIIFLGDPNATFRGTHAHTIRSQVASHLLAAGTPVKEIISAMNWRSSSTFTRFYAKLGIKASVQAVLAGHLPSEV